MASYDSDQWTEPHEPEDPLAELRNAVDNLSIDVADLHQEIRSLAIMIFIAFAVALFIYLRG